MISEVDICNFALNHIAMTTIASLTEDSNTARKCNLMYPLAKDATLRSFDWSFANKVEFLAEIDDTLVGWDYLYARPSDCLFIRKIYSEGSVNTFTPQEDYKEVKTSTGDRAIATNVATAYIEYTSTVPDTSDFDFNFVETLSYKLASMLAKSLTGDMDLANQMELRFINSISEARRISGSERRITPNYTSSYVDVR